MPSHKKEKKELGPSHFEIYQSLITNGMELSRKRFEALEIAEAQAESDSENNPTL